MDQVIDQSHDILEVIAPRILSDHRHELVAVTGRAANVRIDHREAARREQLSPGFQVVYPVSGRTAVNQNHQRIRPGAPDSASRRPASISRPSKPL